MKFENMCRTCLRTPETLLPLAENNELLHKIRIISSVKISSEDELPLWICQECIENVNRSFNFRKVIINSDIELRERYALFKKLEINPQKENFCDEVNENDSNSDSCHVSNESIFEEEDGHKPIIDTLVDEEENINENSTDKLHNEDEKKNEDICVPSNLSKSTKKSYVCTQCEYECTELSEWNIHKKSHVKTKVCDFCGKTVSAYNFSQHRKCHTEEPVKCPYCDKMFKNSISIRHHLSGHKSEKFQCEICGQSFIYRIYYNRHMKRHTDENGRKGTCTICGKVLVEKNRMKAHMRSHTGERPYVCEFCNKGFTTSYARNVHRRQHTKEKPYQCKYCSVAFPVKISLRRHVESKHKDNVESIE